ncbi:MAG: hypothetical protein ACKVX7_13705 [Planctomycetota bacterium]
MFERIAEVVTIANVMFPALLAPYGLLLFHSLQIPMLLGAETCVLLFFTEHRTDARRWRVSDLVTVGCVTVAVNLASSLFGAMIAGTLMQIAEFVPIVTGNDSHGADIPYVVGYVLAFVLSIVIEAPLLYLIGLIDQKSRAWRASFFANLLSYGLILAVQPLLLPG